MDGQNLSEMDIKKLCFAPKSLSLNTAPLFNWKKENYWKIREYHGLLFNINAKREEKEKTNYHQLNAHFATD